MIPHFTLRQNKGEFLIFRMEDDFHILDCNESLTKEKRSTILESGCTPAQMQEMGLSGMTIPKSDIQALTVTGCGFQDDVIFYLKNKKKLSYWLPQAYEQKKLDDFFRGIPRKMVKTRRRLKGGKNQSWREREGNPETAKKVRPIGWVLNGMCVAVTVLALFVRIPDALWVGIVLGLCGIAVALDIFFPEYFTLLFEGKKERRQREGKVTHIGLAPFLSMYPLMIRFFMTIHVDDEFRLLPPALGMTAAVGVVLFLFCREFREAVGQGLVSLFFVFVLCWGLFAPWFNYALGPEPVPVTAVIVNQHKSSGRNTSYYCDVEMPDGQVLTVVVSGSEYDSYELGDTMDLRYGTGFFGVEYAIDG